MKGTGRRKVLFGSNFPMIQPATCIGQLDALGLSDEVRRLFLHDNAKAVFQLDP
jgi:predicted TIM-barrel fold metal-dependent hydrolase